MPDTDASSRYLYRRWVSGMYYFLHSSAPQELHRRVPSLGLAVSSDRTRKTTQAGPGRRGADEKQAGLRQDCTRFAEAARAAYVVYQLQCGGGCAGPIGRSRRGRPLGPAQFTRHMARLSSVGNPQHAKKMLGGCVEGRCKEVSEISGAAGGPNQGLRRSAARGSPRLDHRAWCQSGAAGPV